MGIFGKAKGLQKRLLVKFVYQLAKRKPLINSVLFESFSGKQVGDSPLDLALGLQKSHPDLELFWSVGKPGAIVPNGMKGMKQGSVAWLRVLARSKFLVNNANFPSYFRKREGQVYLQTWHGTPLKLIGLDVKTDRTSSVYQETMKRESQYWDFLLSPSSYCSDIFPKAFSTDAKLLELGYPRNDRLAAIDNADRQAIREKLGVTDPQVKLVLYAPTWRDNNRGVNGGWESVDYLNENSKLPPGFMLLYRGHTNTHSSHQRRPSQNAIDVTFYPDVAELFIASDVLITDYSSVMFDFSVTGKPVIFLAPDIEHYESDRGFYFDLRETAIGPIYKSAPEAIGALTDLANISKTYSEKYRAWQSKFNSKDDGNAANRVIKAVWL